MQVHYTGAIFDAPYRRQRCTISAVTMHHRRGHRAPSGTADSVTPFESKDFTDDNMIAEAAAELFTRNSLLPIHLEEAIKDYMSSL